MRLDQYLCQVIGVASRSKATHLIDMGNVRVDGVIAIKPSQLIDGNVVEIVKGMEFCSMGGYKLEKALKEFGYDARGVRAIDVGASNGGFTDCLLKAGAREIIALDVGDCALPVELVNDDRIVIMDNTNARELTLDMIGDTVDLAVVDLSFISLKLVLTTIASVVRSGGRIIALVKPQFEVGKQHLSKRGIVNSDKIREKCLEDIIDYSVEIGLKVLKSTTAPIRDKKNIEFLILIAKE